MEDPRCWKHDEMVVDEEWGEEGGFVAVRFVCPAVGCDEVVERAVIPMRQEP